MKSKKHVQLIVFPITAFLLLIGISCTKEVNTNASTEQVAQKKVPGTAQQEEIPDPTTTASMRNNDLLKAVRMATARFHSTTQAIKAGYQPDDHCVSVPGLGGMGYHWANFDLVDPVFNPMQPEAVLYANDHNGKLRLVAVEYIVINTGQERPKFGDHLFDIGGTPVQAPHWSLHIWLYEHNPNGMFTPFNPNVTCP